MADRFRGAWIALIVILIDRLTKSTPRALANRHTGALYGGNLVMLLIALALAAALILLGKRRPRWLIVGGLMGNAIDRVLYGGVIDFLEIGFVQLPAFNIAEVCIIIEIIHEMRGAWIALCVLIADRMSKCLALKVESMPLIPGVIRLKLSRNTGAAFSMLKGNNLLLVLISFAMIVALLIIMRKLPRLRVPFWLIIGGALGNVYDRFVYGCVIDFLEPEFVRFAVFNAADICIVSGALLAMLLILKEDRNAGI